MQNKQKIKISAISAQGKGKFLSTLKTKKKLKFFNMNSRKRFFKNCVSCFKNNTDIQFYLTSFETGWTFLFFVFFAVSRKGIAFMMFFFFTEKLKNFEDCLSVCLCLSPAELSNQSDPIENLVKSLSYS